VGTLEEVLVEKIAYEYWRLAVAAGYEADDLDRAHHSVSDNINRISVRPWTN